MDLLIEYDKEKMKVLGPVTPPDDGRSAENEPLAGVPTRLISSTPAPPTLTRHFEHAATLVLVEKGRGKAKTLTISLVKSEKPRMSRNSAARRPSGFHRLDTKKGKKFKKDTQLSNNLIQNDFLKEIAELGEANRSKLLSRRK